MAEFKQNTKLMAKNSAFMYVQMGIKMLIGLYTVRVILHALGAEDYGIYNVVGGFVTMFSFITNTMVSASMRFFAYSIGRNEKEMLNRYFNASLLTFIILAVSLFVIIECIGWWFVNYKMVVPEARLGAANWVLQFAIVAFVVRILAIPFKAMINAHEKMVYSALISVLDSLMLLGIAFLLQMVHADKLKVYSLCMFGVALISTLMYVILCKSSFREDSKIRIRWEGSLMKEMLSYCGWYMFGTMANVVRTQGINMILNLFFGPIVNAARAIAVQIFNAINQFTTSFYNAVRPQITKLTAAENNRGMLSLVFSSSVISFCLTSLLAVPLLVEMPFILSAWLGKFPQYTIVFSRLVLITAMITALGHPLTTSICATGRIRNYQIINSSILILILPVSYFLLKVYLNPYLAFCVSIVFSVIALITKVIFMRRMFGMSIKSYIMDVLMRCGMVLVLSITATYGLRLALGSQLWGHVLTLLLSVVVTLLLSYYVGLKKQQRLALFSSVKNWLSKKKKK